MVILDGSHDNTVAAYDPLARKLVLVTMNYNEAQTIDYDLSSFFEASGPVQCWTTETTETGSRVTYEPSNLSINNKIFSSAIGANTIQTFEIQNVDINPLPQLTIKLVANASQVILSWPTLYADFNLYRANALDDSDAWQRVTDAPEVSNEHYQVTVPTVGHDPQFFRLSNQ